MSLMYLRVTARLSCGACRQRLWKSGFNDVRRFSGTQSSTLMTLVSVTKRVSTERTLFQDINVAFQKGEKIGLLGRNGVGKSSLLKIIAGVDTEFDGEVRKSSDVTIAYLHQEPKLKDDLNVRECIVNSLRDQFDLLLEYEEVSECFAEEGAEFSELCEKQAKLQVAIDEKDVWNLDRRIDITMKALHCPPAYAKVADLSGGERRRVALCSLLLQDADMLLLDEPTNHLDAVSVSWLEQFLGNYRGTVISVTHDRYFLDNVAQSIAELSRESLNISRGNYSCYLENRAVRDDIMQKTAAKRSTRMMKELVWIRRGGKKTGQKARLKKMALLNDKQRSKELVESNIKHGRLVIPTGPRLGSRVLKVTQLKKIFGHRVLFENVSFTLEPGNVVGVIGANGSGKSTLLRMIAGEIEPNEGSITMGQTVKIGFVTQSRQDLNEEESVCREIVPDLLPVMVGDFFIEARRYVAQFNFCGSDQDKSIKHLSGGERNRVHLAKLLRTGCNTLLLDEPTNDLDVETLRSLEESLSEFPGCAIIVSHDRWFLDRTCTHILQIHADGKVTFDQGNYSEVKSAMAKLSGEASTKVEKTIEAHSA